MSKEQQCYHTGFEIKDLRIGVCSIWIKLQNRMIETSKL